MPIEAAVVADSVSQAGARLTTFQIRFPACIWPEVLTHRQLSRNAASTRAIPTARMCDLVACDPYVPRRWYANQPGMQGGEEITGEAAALLEQEWREAARQAVERVRALDETQPKPHKQHINRLLMPWLWLDAILSATEWANFFALRDHPAAQPEMQDLARMMVRARAESVPELLEAGQWHLPYVRDAERGRLEPEDARAVSVARCCRVSTLRTGVEFTLEQDWALYHKLLCPSGRETARREPIHASPFEHQGRPAPFRGTVSGNFRGWHQLRQTLRGESVPEPAYAGPTRRPEWL